VLRPEAAYYLENDMQEKKPSPEQLSSAERRELKKRAHSLKPVTTVSQQGVPAALDVLGSAFQTTDLLKIRLSAADRHDADALAEELARKLGCLLVARTGRVAILYHRS
jgi:RNA-binding protein